MNPALLTMVHNNPVQIEHGQLIVDRKFLTGMERFCAALPVGITSVHPLARPGHQPMDPVAIPLDGLGFRVLALSLNAKAQPDAASKAALRAQVAASKLVYGSGYGAVGLAQQLGRPYILLLEYDLPTRLTVARTSVAQPLRRLVRHLRGIYDYYWRQLPEVRRAHSVHCNGYPIYEALAAQQPNRLLYLDSRMEQAMVLPAQTLEQRLQQVGARPLRLIFSGRYEPMKGALDAVRVGLACLQLGIRCEMDCYGQGGQAAQMRELASRSEGRVRVHEAIPFPELVAVARSCDLFVCCHIQNDPSCTYLESMGAGLPIVGYDNRMWRGMQAHSGAGVLCPLGNPEAAAQQIGRLAANPVELATLSRKAREFALAHSFEQEFHRRIEALRQALAA